MTARLQQLDEIEQSIWSELEACVASCNPGPGVAGGTGDGGPSQHEWRIAVLATLDDNQADARSIVLREVDTSARSLVFYTDARSPKVRQIEASPAGALIFWSRAIVAPGQAADVRWRTRLSCLSANAPGSVLDAPLATIGTRGRSAHPREVVSRF